MLGALEILLFSPPQTPPRLPAMSGQAGGNFMEGISKASVNY
jgi:hypothetical protein